jgi:hypothetical protein
VGLEVLDDIGGDGMYPLGSFLASMRLAARLLSVFTVGFAQVSHSASGKR